MTFTPAAAWVTIGRSSISPYNYYANISPPLNSFDLVQTNTFTFTLRDSQNATRNYSLSITVKNTEPYFTNTLSTTSTPSPVALTSLMTSPIIVNVGVTKKFTLPTTMFDLEGHTITVLNDFGSAYVFSCFDNATNTYSFTQLNNSISGTFIIRVKLSDNGNYTPSVYTDSF